MVTSTQEGVRAIKMRESKIMRTFAATALALSLLVWTISGDAQSVQRGYEAAQQGDVETAF